MGEIADAMIDGDMCSLCGEWLGNGGGYSRLCYGCKAEERNRQNKLKKSKKADEAKQKGVQIDN